MERYVDSSKLITESESESETKKRKQTSHSSPSYDYSSTANQHLSGFFVNDVRECPVPHINLDHVRVSSGVSSIFRQHAGRLGGVLCAWIDTDGDPGEQAVLNLVP